jgi:prepilin-type N-terminal cleavage/methylation domain-containing protein
MTLQRKQSGFTIVELLIVIVVIGILAALVITTFTGIQQRARNTERETDIKALHSQIEAYYAQKGNYPRLADVNSATWRGTNMKGLDAEAIKDPKWADTVTACTAGGAPVLDDAAGANCYSYVVLDSADAAAPCAADETVCAKYTLTATKEGGGTYIKTSLN